LGGLAFLITPVWTLAAGVVLLRAQSIDEATETVEIPSRSFSEPSA
jgi:hypothetical protein